MVAGLLRILGINMGDNIDEKNHEDLDLQHRHYLHLRDLIAEKNEKHNEWGWKDPMLIDQIYDVLELCPLRNPIFIVVFRDTVATARALCREEGWTQEYAFDHVVRQTDKLYDFCQDYRDAITISYEKSLTNPRELVESLNANLALQADEGTLQRGVEFIKPGYRNVDCST